MINNLKKLVSEMDSKIEFVQTVSAYYGTSVQATMRNWFQYWNVPADKLPKIVEMAQLYLYEQNLRQRLVLKETGFLFESKALDNE